MKKVTLLVLIGAFAFAGRAIAQEDTWGIIASFSGDNSNAFIDCAVSQNLEIAVGLGLESVSYSYPSGVTAPDSKTSLGIEAGVRYFLKHADVSPYIGGLVMYTKSPDDKTGTTTTKNSAIAIQGIFGGQAMVSKNVGIFGHIGVTFNMATTTVEPQGGSSQDFKTNTLSLFTSAVGAVFYF
jgi:hypothetical protein